MLYSYTESVEKYKHYNKPIKPLLFDCTSNEKPKNKESEVIKY